MTELIYRTDRAAGLPNPPAAYCIFYHPFLCTVPRIHLMGDVHFKRIGVGVSGDKKIDAEMLKEKITTYITISRMIELHHRGVSFVIESVDQTVEVYKLLKQHLTDWDLELTHSINRRDPPTESLIAMDSFATTLWGVAKYYVKDPIHSISLFRALEDMGRGNMLTRNRLEMLQREAFDHSTTEHNPFKAALAKHDANLRKQNNDY